MAKFLYEENDIPEKIKFFVNRRLKIRLKLLEDKDDKSFICNKNETKSNKKKIFMYVIALVLIMKQKKKFK